MCQIILLVGVSYSGYQLSTLNMFQYSLSRPSRAGFLPLREYASVRSKTSGKVLAIIGHKLWKRGGPKHPLWDIFSNKVSGKIC